MKSAVYGTIIIATNEEHNDSLNTIIADSIRLCSNVNTYLIKYSPIGKATITNKMLSRKCITNADLKRGDNFPLSFFPISIAKNLESLFDNVLFKNIINIINVPIRENTPKFDIPNSSKTHLLLNKVSATDITVLVYETTVLIIILF
ncbi:hypothetical protein NXY11_13190 [Parabacteroides faecis]|uniref:hypothetical protein n=1 Tax=Parabacteroides faecis TaxID=1217282 RepID=UPI0021649DD4|nr:hypothetical protein [Parabacteroides faecis]UVQ49122.1 hypothetical protein NXY11_13190 [Parabacteroides faecis]